MAIKNLYFDTTSIVKYFVDEKGSEIVRWIVNNRIQYSTLLHTGKQAQAEFEPVIRKIAKRKGISDNKTNDIIYQAKQWYFTKHFRIRDNKTCPNFKCGKNVELVELVNKYKLIPGKTDWDAKHLQCIINYLRFLGGASAVQVVTSDKDFIKIIKEEGYKTIDPEIITIEEIKKVLTTQPGA